MVGAAHSSLQNYFSGEDTRKITKGKTRASFMECNFKLIGVRDCSATDKLTLYLFFFFF